MQGIDAVVNPEGSLEVLSRLEVAKLGETGRGGLHEIFRRCALAVLNSGSYVDDARAVLEQYRDFDIGLVPEGRGIKLRIVNAPPAAFVDGRMIRGIREHLFSVLRDVLYISNEILENPKFDLNASAGITDAVFHILRNARAIRAHEEPNLAVCWGGHSISREEYDYSKEVGYELGLRGLDVCTGCGPGAMKGPMKGAAIGHAKQRIPAGRYVGVSDPEIIAAESPNPIVNELVVMPDMEKRLEAFIRIGHAFVVFPGGVGTTEEILYLLGIRLHPDNRHLPFPLILTGPMESERYFAQLHDFIKATLGPAALNLYKVIIADPELVAREVREGVDKVADARRDSHDAFYFNWQLHVDYRFQQPFAATHENMAALDLHRDQAPHDLAGNLRRAFSGIVAGNVKDPGIRAVEEHGPFLIRGEPAVMKPLDDLLRAFVADHRMRLPGTGYTPCYRIEH